MKVRTRQHNSWRIFDERWKVKKEIAESPKTFFFFLVMFIISSIISLMLFSHDVNNAGILFVPLLMCMVGFWWTLVLGLNQYHLHATRIIFKKTFERKIENKANLLHHQKYYKDTQNIQKFLTFKNELKFINIFFTWFTILLIFFLYVMMEGFWVTSIAATIVWIIIYPIIRLNKSYKDNIPRTYYSIKIWGEKYYHDKVTNTIYFY